MNRTAIFRPIETASPPLPPPSTLEHYRAEATKAQHEAEELRKPVSCCKCGELIDAAQRGSTINKESAHAGCVLTEYMEAA